MKILVAHYNPGQGGGAESAIRDQAEALTRLGHEVRLEFLDPIRGYAQFKPDIIHFHTIHVGWNLTPLQWAQKAGIPHCLSLHDYWPFCSGRMLLREGDQPCAAVRGRCDGDCNGRPADASVLPVVNASPVVAFNEHTADIYRRHGLRVDAVIPHGIDTEFFSPSPDRHEGVRIVTTSAWPEYPTKGMHVLKAALKLTGFNASLVAHVPRQQVRDELRQSDVFVFPSCYEETWGLCLTEAMACGLACIASDVCGPRAQLTGEPPRGVLVPPREPEALARALQALVDDAGVRAVYGHNARAWAAEQCTLERMGREYEAFYGTLVRG
jgi:glycosyltransferase involved in cell wall biosynthesis